MSKKSKKLANEIINSGLDYALYREKNPKTRIKAYRQVAQEFNLLADQMSWEIDEREISEQRG